jgi:hypothetical protein
MNRPGKPGDPPVRDGDDGLHGDPAEGWTDDAVGKFVGGGSRGQSAQVGLVLLLAVAVLALATVQLTLVPSDNAAVETRHSQDVRESLVEVRNRVVSAPGDATVGDRTRRVEVPLGTDYPDRPFLVEPAPPGGALVTVGTGDPGVNVTVRNATAVGAETADRWNGSPRTFETGGLRYRPSYNEFDDAPTTLYGATVLSDRYDDRTVPLTDQRLVEGDRITVVTLAGEFSRARSGPATASVPVQTVSASARRVPVAGENLSLTVPTRLSAATWRDLLADEFAPGGNVVGVSTAPGPGAFDRLTVDLAANETYELSMARVGVGGTTPPPVAYLTDVRGDDRTVAPGGSVELVVEARDRYNNPVAGESVSATVGGDGRLRTTTATVDERGRATFVYEAPPEPGDATVEARLPGASGPDERVSFDLQVAAGRDTTGDGGGAVTWNRTALAAQPGVTCSASGCRYDRTLDPDGNLTLTARRTDGGGNVPVEFAVSDRSIGRPTDDRSRTAAGGTARTTLSTTGTGRLLAYVVSAGAGARLPLEVVAGSLDTLVWTDATDWDAASARAVVHDGYGDHDAGVVQLGYPVRDRTGPRAVAVYPLDADAGTTAREVVAGRNGTTAGGVAVGAGGVLNTSAFAFDPSDESYVDVPAVVGDRLRGTASLSTWIRTTQSGDDTMWQAPGITGVESSGDGDDIFWGWLDADGRIGIQAGDAAAAKSTTRVNDGSWHHVAFTRNDTTGRVAVYVDGRLEDAAASRSAPVTTAFDSLGRIEDTAGSPEYLDGRLDELRVYDRVLSETDVSRLFDAGRAGGLTTDGQSLSRSVDPADLRLVNVSAVVPADTGLEVVVESRPPGAASFNESSDPVALSTGRTEYAVPTGGLTTSSARYRLRIRPTTTDPTRTSCLAGVELTADGTGTEVVDVAGCGERSTGPNAEPTASFSLTPGSPRAGETVTVDAGGSSDPDGRVASYEWSFGDGTTAGGETATHRYSAPGSYAVELTVTDDSGETDTRVQTVTVGTATLDWRTAADWDGATNETGVVHESFGDHAADRVDVGYPSTGRWDRSPLAYYPLDGSGTATDATGNGRSATNAGATGERPGAVGTAYAFQGGAVLRDDDAGTYLNGLSTVTLSTWVRSNVTGSDAGIVFTDDSQGRDDRLGLRYDREGFLTSRRGGLKYSVGVDGTEYNAETPSGLQRTAWQHLAVTWADGDPIRLYVDGLAVPPAATNGDPPSGTLSGVTRLLVGRGAKFGGDANGWNGRLDELRIYDRRLSATTVSRLYDAGSEGNLTTGSERFPGPVNASRLALTNLTANTPPGTNVTLTVEARRGGSWVESDPVVVDDSTTATRVEVTGLSGTAERYRLRVDLAGSVGRTPSLDRVDLAVE